MIKFSRSNQGFKEPGDEIPAFAGKTDGDLLINCSLKQQE
jgi:hypothetical protein